MRSGISHVQHRIQKTSQRLHTSPRTWNPAIITAMSLQLSMWWVYTISHNKRVNMWIQIQIYQAGSIYSKGYCLVFENVLSLHLCVYFDRIWPMRLSWRWARRLRWRISWPCRPERAATGPRLYPRALTVNPPNLFLSLASTYANLWVILPDHGKHVHARPHLNL